MESPAITTIGEYIAQYDGEVKAVLDKTWETIRMAAPEAVEKISWRMPTFWQKENLIHFAAQKKHLGIYPGELAIEVFKDRLADYKTSKGAIQFPYNQPIPYELIADITRFRVAKAEETGK